MTQQYRVYINGTTYVVYTEKELIELLKSSIHIDLLYRDLDGDVTDIFNIDINELNFKEND